MKPILFFCLLLLSTVSISSERPDYSSFVGVFEGMVVNGSEHSSIVTTLVVTSDGRLRGSYVVNSVSGTFNGNLSNPRLSGESTVSFEWTDKDGEGYEELVFSEDFNSFRGFWSDRNSNSQHLLTGERK